jgi:hypothetical protein
VNYSHIARCAFKKATQDFNLTISNFKQKRKTMKISKIAAVALIAVLLISSVGAFAKGGTGGGGSNGGGKPCKWVLVSSDPVTGTNYWACSFRRP